MYVDVHVGWRSDRSRMDSAWRDRQSGFGLKGEQIIKMLMRTPSKVEKGGWGVDGGVRVFAECKSCNTSDDGVSDRKFIPATSCDTVASGQIKKMIAAF